MSTKQVRYKFTWSKSHTVSAQIVGDVYYSLPRRTPEALVEAAKSKKSPLHRLFEWSDRDAAREYRLIQARVIVNSLQVEIVNVKGKPSHVNAFIYSSDRGRHVPTMEATRDELTEAMQDCWREMLAFRARFKNLEMAAQVIQAIDDVDRRLSRSKAARRRVA